MTEKLKISDAEWAVMNVLWAKSPRTANQIIDALAESKDWSPKTIRTLINRLAQKNIIKANTETREYTYTPLVDESECVMAETKTLFQRIRSAALTPALAAFIKEQELSSDDIEQLKQILDDKQNQAK